jgi:phospholipid/cholesterol/gamma-HCH transport system ATP-binding protein
VPPQIQPSAGLPERKAVARRQQRVLEMLHTMPEKAQEAIRKVLDQEHEEERSARGESARDDRDDSDDRSDYGDQSSYRSYDVDDERPTQSLHLGQS